MKWLDVAHSSAKQCINGMVSPNPPVVSMPAMSTHVILQDPEKTDQLDGMHASDHDASSQGQKRWSPPAESSTSGPSKKKATTKRADSKVLIDKHDSDFITSDEDPDERNGGGKMFPLLKLITKPCRRKKVPPGEEGRKYVRCIGSKGCHQTWRWKRDKDRILKHAIDCSYIASLDSGQYVEQALRE